MKDRFDLRIQEQRLAFEIQAEEDRKILETLDALGRDPPCGVCRAPRTSEGAEAGCDHCIVRQVMIT